ncbi:MAG: hypothetical protein KF764_07885 [Labilithrix sp.]|nr:hypothetical protein [Labilithrix sp.]
MPASTTPSTAPMQAAPVGSAPAEAAPAEPRPPAAPDPHNAERPACDEPAATASADKKTRHTGFHVRGELGLASMGASASTQGSRVEIGGLSTIASLLVGGAVVENLIIAGELWTMRAFEPDWKSNGAPLGIDMSATLSGVGANVSYYLVPANVFFSVTPSVGVLAIEDRRDRSGTRTKTGFSARMAIGKEWWVASHFGIGVAANGYLGINGDELRTEAATSTFYWTTHGAGVSFTGSYN